MIIHKDKHGKIIRKELEVGDTIKALGHTFKINKILNQDYFDHDDFGNPDYFDVEFKDPNDGYHHYKSQFDKGIIIPERTCEYVH